MERGRGNALVNLGIPDDDGHLVKAERLRRIDDIVRGLQRWDPLDRGDLGKAVEGGYTIRATLVGFYRKAR